MKHGKLENFLDYRNSLNSDKYPLGFSKWQLCEAWGISLMYDVGTTVAVFFAILIYFSSLLPARTSMGLQMSSRYFQSDGIWEVPKFFIDFARKLGSLFNLDKKRRLK